MLASFSDNNEVVLVSKSLTLSRRRLFSSVRVVISFLRSCAGPPSDPPSPRGASLVIDFLGADRNAGGLWCPLSDFANWVSSHLLTWSSSSLHQNWRLIFGHIVQLKSLNSELPRIFFKDYKFQLTYFPIQLNRHLD